VTTVLLPPDPVNIATSALRWVYRDELDTARYHLQRLTSVELAEAGMHAARLSALIQSMRGGAS
jgi:hypothetical protein